MRSHRSTSVALVIFTSAAALIGALPASTLAATLAPTHRAAAPTPKDTLSRRDRQQIQALMSPTLLPAQQAYLKASNAGTNDGLGNAVAISGNTVVVGAAGEASNAIGVDGNQGNNSAAFSGAAYVFTRSGTAWSQQAYLKASNTGTFDLFGVSVAIAGDTIVVGAVSEASNETGVNGPNQANNDSPGSGAAYVFTRSGTTWSQQGYLKASNTGDFDRFGQTVAVSGDTVVVGAGHEQSGAGSNGDQADNSLTGAGAVYVFTRSGTDWSQQAYLKASNRGMDDQFGSAVDITGDTLVVGAGGEDSKATGVDSAEAADDSASNSGSAYVFVRSGTNWSQQAYLKASNTSTEDRFGFAAAVSGDTVVVGASAEDSNSTGGEADNNAPDAGAAYVFTRNGTTWSQQAYLKASNTQASDFFGASVGVSGDTIVVGGRQEDSNGTGVNGPNQANNSEVDAGAAYVFMRSGTTWLQQAYLKASNTNANDIFGYSAAINGDTIVIGAPQEASSAGGNQADNSTFDAGAAYVFRTPSECQPGYYSSTGDDTNGCTAADPGYYVAAAGATTQTAADIGYYVDAVGATGETACPHGTTTANVASDSASDCVPLSPYANKQGASASLKALIPTGWAPSDELLTKATFRIDKSLASWRWIDGSTLNPLHGYRVFNSERKAVRFLTSPLFAGNSTVSTAITDLVSADRAVVVKAINDSTDATAKDAANQKLALADSRIAAGKYGPAIKALKQAWLAVA